MTDLYTAVVAQTDRIYVKKREEIKEKVLPSILKVMNFAVKKKAHGHSWAPARLMVFPEVFLQGWLRPMPGEEMTFEAQADQSIRIPGDETDVIAKKATELGIYVAGSSMELDPDWVDMKVIWNTSWIMSPQGKIILKYRKMYPAIFLPGPRSCRISPHDVYDEYVRKYGKNSFFPVVDTDIGKLACLICTDGFFPEVARALTLNGAEVLLRSSGMVSPWGQPPLDSFEIENRFHGMTNLTYVVAPAPGRILSDFEVQNSLGGGNSMIVDFNGMVLTKVNFPGEAVTSAVIDIPLLRKRRTGTDFKNSLIMLRTEVMSEVYSRSIYPPNTMSMTSSDADMGTANAYIQGLVKKGLISQA